MRHCALQMPKTRLYDFKMHLGCELHHVCSDRGAFSFVNDAQQSVEFFVDLKFFSTFWGLEKELRIYYNIYMGHARKWARESSGKCEAFYAYYRNEK